ncbi:hypothetical protein HO173_003452 [Letharia columbiana]|uniref:Uncharacterized protein n=1 Tax=Letharia columbiana TaxID=112416 RepID=A0A8H6G120_9LECA|nr:uncharacterized protein HO173_003452 [Letharia columbiana]KAF6238484.1 hypothetical protein HO173_003452 [Letharia columbiana]
MPSSTLPPPSQGLTVYHVALGRGLQNYTCPLDAGSSDVPIALGAVANLYNTTCMASVPIPGGNPPTFSITPLQSPWRTPTPMQATASPYIPSDPAR